MDTYEKRDRFLSAPGDWMIEQGYSNTCSMKITDRVNAVGVLVKQIIFYRFNF